MKECLALLLAIELVAGWPLPAVAVTVHCSLPHYTPFVMAPVLLPAAIYVAITALSSTNVTESSTYVTGSSINVTGSWNWVRTLGYKTNDGWCGTRGQDPWPPFPQEWNITMNLTQHGKTITGFCDNSG